MSSPENTPSRDFIRTIIDEDIRTGKHDGRVHTRFPPEPNGYLHIGHATAFCLDFGIAGEYGGLCNLRFDDTNPVKEDTEYVDSIQEDIRWLGFDWDDRLCYASDYFEQLYDYAEDLIKKGKAYVCDLTPGEIREYRGSLREPGRNSPYRERSVDDNLDLFRRMRAMEFPDGARVLRAKIDMTHPNLLMRDPIMYRILHAAHHRTGNEWCIYPTYDWAHGQSDSIERITHSLCSLEFDVHRPLYDWFIEELGIFRSRQYEFARFNLSFTVMSKRILKRLVDGGFVNGWDDPRMPTLGGLRRRGYSPASIRDFCKRVGVSKVNSTTAMELLEHCVRQDLNRTSPRFMGVLRLLKVIIDNYPEGQVEEFEAVNNPEDPDAGTRKVPFSRELYIEREDFMEDPPRKFFRLSPGREVRLRYAYFVTCTDVVKDGDTGEILEVHCTYDPETKGGDAPDGRRVKATMHWVSAAHALDAEVRLYDKLFTVEDPLGEEGEFTDYVNPDSLETLGDSKVEPAAMELKELDRIQFERQGYFCVDRDSTGERLVFNRTVTLRDTWARMKKQKQQQQRKKGKGKKNKGQR